MSPSTQLQWSYRAGAAGALLLAVAFGVGADTPTADQARHLHAQYRMQAERLQHNPFGRPLWIDSSLQSGRLHGELSARLEHPFADLDTLLADAAGWCEVLVLLPNIRRCVPTAGGLRLGIARRFDQPVADTEPVEFALDVQRSSAVLQADLHAAAGPLGTHDYRIRISAVPLPGEQTFLQLDYGYAYGTNARIAASLYFATRGRHKIGFSVVGGSADTPQHVDGLRGAIERTAMRLYLAVDARLQAGALPPDARLEDSLRRWLRALEAYPRQLRELDPAGYLAAKRDPAALPAARSAAAGSSD